MNEDSNGIRPQISTKSLDEELISSILPSYHMFQSTISKRLVPNEENFRVDPPTYELSPMNSGAVTPVASAAMSPMAVLELSNFPFPSLDDDNEDFTQNSAQLFEKTILANVYKLDNLMDSSNPMASHLDVQITFTDSVCQKGVKPNIIDVSNREYRQDDYLHGFVTLTNRYKEPIPFDIVYVMFEGCLVAALTPTGPTQAKQFTVSQFLNMPDLYASWTYANIDRLATDEGNPHDWCEGETDPYDNTVLSIDAKRLFQPGVTYKRFFSFRIPDRILDDNCEVHSLDSHCCVVPTLGIPVNINSRRAPEYSEKKIKDFSFVDSSISYSVSTKIIGRASQYNDTVPKDKFVLTKEVSVPIRVLPYTLRPEYPDYVAKKVSASYKAFKDMVEKKLDEGQLVLLSQNSMSMASLTSVMSQILATNISPTGLNGEKLRHLYHVSSVNHKNHKSEEPPVYQSLISYRKQKLTGFSKVLGVFSLSTPKTTYTFQYIPPKAYRNPLQSYNTKLEIPLDISYFYEKEGELQLPPEPKSITCELVVLTIRSRKNMIPIEFNHEMCFDDHVVDDVSSKKVGEEANFDSIVVKPFHDYLYKLSTIMKKVGFDNEAFRVETQFFKDIKSMAMLQTKYINLSIPDVKLERSSESGIGYYKNLGAVPWEESQSSVNPNYKIFTKKVNLHVDLDNCHLKGGSLGKKSAFDTICLVPDFQTCFLGRLYYMRIGVTHKNGVTQVVHVPVTVEA